MVTLSAIHIIFLCMTAFILVALLFKKEIVIPCIIGILLIGFAWTHSVIQSIQILNNALIASNGELFSIILVIAVVTAMSKAMHNAGIDELMIRPIRKVIHTPKQAFWGIGLVMLIASWLIWPSPAVALVGALLLPIAGTVGLPAIWAAVAMNLFGHGMGLSSDFFIQGAPGISSSAAGIDITELTNSVFPLWLVMSITMALVAYLMMRRELKVSGTSTESKDVTATYKEVLIKKPRAARILTILIAASFIAIIIAMLQFNIVGGDATALITGTALILACIITLVTSGIRNGLSDLVDYLVQGFTFSMKIFAPVIVIAAFFFLGSQDFATSVLGDGAPAILNDISLYLSNTLPMNKAAVIIIELLVGVITGLDGSGFSGLPLVGSVAATLGASTGSNIAILTAIGQLTTVCVGGGTVIPWAVVPVAAICGISPNDLARKNLIPVICGIALASIVALFLL